MRRPLAATLLGLAIALSIHVRADEPASNLPPPADRQVDFAADIQPLFQKNCYSCHGPEQQEGGLRLDDRQRALEGGDAGTEIVPGNSAKSRLVRVIAGVDEEYGQMPPDGKGKPLSTEEVALVRAWIDQGAKWPESLATATARSDHWSLRPVKRPALPKVDRRAWLQEPVDAFVLARLEQEKISPSPPAQRATLLRRLYLDLIGLLPAPEEIKQFAADDRPDAVERLIDRLLASPHFGERWGRHWLDLARYADSDGYEKDRPRPFAFRYRDWVIAAINADMPYDQFTIEQLAGDLLPEATTEQRIAVGLHRNTLHNTEGGIDPEEDRVKKTVDRTNTLGSIWLGLTVGCAQCHTHKYDPITQREYFSLYAFFNSIDEHDLEAPSAEQLAALKAAKQKHATKLATLEAELASYVAEKLPEAQQKWELTLAGLPEEELAKQKLPANVAAAISRPAEERSEAELAAIREHYQTIDATYVKLQKAVTDRKAKAPQLPPEAKAQSVVELKEPRPTHIHLRGDFLSPGDAVPVSTPAALPPLDPRGEAPDRLDLGQWLVDPANPLPARVAANRYWYRLLGRGIVTTLDDFGKQGEEPSHPELLDWLASEFAGPLDWSPKRLIRRIVQSATYQQLSAPRSELEAVDPENVLLARQVRKRVEAEIIRDLALSASGELAARIGGPSVRPPQPAEYAGLTYANSAKWIESQGADRYRRGLYTFFQRTSPYPMLMTFDSPDSNLCTASRQTSNTPLQALTLWNDPVFFEAAQALARRVVAEVPAAADAGETTRQRAERAFVLCLSRQPTDAERGDVLSLYSAALELARADEEAAVKIAGAPPPSKGTDFSDLAAWVSVARTLLNLDEFITRE